MTARPAWMDALNLFDYGFSTVAHVFFGGFGILIIVAVSRPGLRQHLRWANASAVSCILTGCGRFLRDMHFFFGLGQRYTVSLSVSVLYYLATAFAVYSTYMLWRILRDTSLFSNPSEERLVQPGVWPPPPVMKG